MKARLLKTVKKNGMVFSDPQYGSMLFLFYNLAQNLSFLLYRPCQTMFER